MPDATRSPAPSRCLGLLIGALALLGRVPAQQAGPPEAASPQAVDQQPEPGSGGGVRPWEAARLIRTMADQEKSGLLGALQQAAVLRSQRGAALAAQSRLQRDHREYNLRINMLLDQLGDPRWATREDAEKRLTATGARAWGLIQKVAADGETLEQRQRAARVLQGIRDRGTADAERDLRLMQGLAFAARAMPGDPALTRALASCLEHPDALVRYRALLALGEHGDANTIGALMAMRAKRPGLDPVAWWGAMCRSLLVAGIDPATVSQEVDAAWQQLWGGSKRWDLQSAVVRGLLPTGDGDAPRLARLIPDTGPVPAAARSAWVSGGVGSMPSEVQVQLADGGTASGQLLAVTPVGLLLDGLVSGLGPFPLAWSECAEIRQPPRGTATTPKARVFLVQGSVICGQKVTVTADRVTLTGTVFGDVELPRDGIQGIALDPNSTRLVGLSGRGDRLRLRGEAQLLDGHIESFDGLDVQWRDAKGSRSLPASAIQCLMFRLASDPDPTSQDVRFTRVDTAAGDRLLVHLWAGDGDRTGLTMPGVGWAIAPMGSIVRMSHGVAGGAQWRFTLAADYAEGRVVEFDDQGRETFALTDVVGVWDAECLADGNILVTEFTASRVREFDRRGRVVWEFRQVRNPYDADRLANGNTLIADTYGGRVVEVDPSGAVVWSLGDGIRPLDVDRLANGNTLIADSNGSRILEVDPSGKTVWQAEDIKNPYDADRLANGNTLVTLREEDRVVELRPDGSVAWELTGLRTPSDADRLANGNTLVAENSHVREFTPAGRVVATLPVAWAVEANRY